MCSNGLKRLNVISLDKTKYLDIWRLQKKLVNLRCQGKIPDCLIITEHEPVITMGRNALKNNLLVSHDELEKRGIDFYKVERNGDMAYHGPGQLIVYPIVDLKERGRDLHQYLRSLEDAALSAIKKIGLAPSARKTMPGIWVNNHLVAGMGVAVLNWVTYHGVAIHVNNGFDYTELVNHWGITRFANGSLSSLLHKKVTLNKVGKIFTENFAEILGYKPEKKVKEIEELAAT